MSLKNILNSIFVSDEETEVTVNDNSDEFESEPLDYETENISDFDEAVSHMNTNEKRNNVININDGKKSSIAMQVSVPRVYSEAERVGQQLLEGKGLILNFSRMSEPDARRFIDYLAGIVYAVGGDMQRVASDVFLAVPQNMDIEGSFEDVEPKQSDTHRSSSVWQRKGQED